MLAWSDLKNKIIISIVFGMAIVAVLAMSADLPRTLAALRGFTWRYLPLILGLTLVNYGLRFVKWHYYLGQIDAGHVSLSDSLKIFVAGFTMVMTPGKVGELYKAWALKETNDVAISRAAPIVLAERITDGLAMVVLASAGLLLYRFGAAVLSAVVLTMGGFVVVVQVRPLALWFLRQGERMPILSRFAPGLREFYESAYRLLGVKNLLFAVGLGIVSWAAEGVALFLVLLGLGFVAAPALLVQAVSALALSTILGAVTFLPGGLGVVDGSLAGLLLFLTGAGADTAVAATLIIRLATLWFGVALGLSTLVAFRRQLLPASTPYAST
ncbi:MAG: lysylphosphatidylglycerol synthase transmembrane domain-containing protein [Anaerolineae bacterium]